MFKNLTFKFHNWVFWTLTGWPFKRRCPECGGDGHYTSETAARYGDEPDPCSRCSGTGRIKRHD